MCGLSCFFNDTATTEIYTLSLHDALPISAARGARACPRGRAGRAQGKQGTFRSWRRRCQVRRPDGLRFRDRSEEHTSELQSRQYLVCRLLLEKKKKNERKYTQLQILTAPV